MPEANEELKVVEKPEDKGFEVDLNRWKYRDMKAFRQAVREDDEEVFAPLVERVLVEWPFEQDITAENILELGMVDLMTTLRAVNLAAERVFRSG